MVQDAWNEQLVKRGWLDWKIPSALQPDLAPIWLVVLGLAGLTAVALRWDRPRPPTGATDDVEKRALP